MGRFTLAFPLRCEPSEFLERWWSEQKPSAGCSLSGHFRLERKCITGFSVLFDSISDHRLLNTVCSLLFLLFCTLVCLFSSGVD